LDGVAVDVREANEDARVVFVMRGGVVDVRLFFDERVAVGEIAVDGERVRLCRLVHRDAGKPTAVDLERWRSPSRAGGCVWELQPNLADDVEGERFHPSASRSARCCFRRDARSSAKRFTAAKTESGSRWASAITSASSPPVSHWLSQSAVSEYASVSEPTLRSGHMRRVPLLTNMRSWRASIGSTAFR